MTHCRSLNHSKWACQYHVVFIPKYRKKVIYGEPRRYLGEVLRCVARQRESEGCRLNRHIAPKAAQRFRRRVRQLTRRSRGVSLTQMVEQLASYLRGWRGYFGFCETSTALRDLDSWIRRRLRCVIWSSGKFFAAVGGD